MKISVTIVNRMLIAGALVATVSVTGTASASTDDNAVDGLLVASASYKGEHPNKSHSAYESNKPVPQSEVTVVNTRVDMKGRPPYNRHAMHNKQLEKVQFARFEETSVISEKQRNPIYRSSQGIRPPYQRNW